MTSAAMTAQRYEHSIETQRRLGAAPRYNQWICDLISPYIQGHLLDIGSAIGNITQFFLDRESITSVDIEAEYVSYLNNTFGKQAPLEAHLCDAADPAILELFAGKRFDSAMCLNVIEHIPDHQAVLNHVFALLKPGGHFAVVAPAGPWLYGTMDAADHHCRRYRLTDMVAIFEQAGFDVVRSKYFNFIGALGWFYYGRVLKREFIPGGSTLGFADRLIRIGRAIERFIPTPLGQSVLCVGQKPHDSDH
ncbi:MAG: class I SAM-dependent methyltransferase [Planctomycetes bacterium]|nr:class I SAM-dependent methyltransferase [Planctomycetota bacterium]